MWNGGVQCDRGMGPCHGLWDAKLWEAEGSGDGKVGAPPQLNGTGMGMGTGSSMGAGNGAIERGAIWRWMVVVPLWISVLCVLF